MEAPAHKTTITKEEHQDTKEIFVFSRPDCRISFYQRLIENSGVHCENCYGAGNYRTYQGLFLPQSEICRYHHRVVHTATALVL
jgi:hypothetical protein